jgi:hypothetical protein
MMKEVVTSPLLSLWMDLTKASKWMDLTKASKVKKCVLSNA